MVYAGTYIEIKSSKMYLAIKSFTTLIFLFSYKVES